PPDGYFPIRVLHVQMEPGVRINPFHFPDDALQDHQLGNIEIRSRGVMRPAGDARQNEVYQNGPHYAPWQSFCWDWLSCAMAAAFQPMLTNAKLSGPPRVAVNSAEGPLAQSVRAADS